jgi:hypothetical protein
MTEGRRPDDAVGSGSPSGPPPGENEWGPAQQPRWGQQEPLPPPGPAPAPAPQYGQYGQPQYGQYGPPQFGQPGTGYGYAPRPAAPRPGIIPLRPLSLGELLDGAFRAIRTNPRVMFGLSAAVVTLTALIQLAITWTVFQDLEALLVTSTAGTASDLESLDAALGDLVTQLGVAFGAQTISAVVTTILSGLLIISVSQSVLGRKASLAEVWSSAKGQILRLLGLSFLVLLIVLSPMVPWAAILVVALADEQWGLAVAVGILGGLAMLVGVAFLVTKTVLATPALMLERTGIGAALRRGWLLTTGAFWRVLGIYLLTALLVSVVSGAISGSTSIILQFTGPDPTAAVFTPAYLIGSTIAQIAAAVLTTPFTAAVIALLYIDVRMRKEGLDLELARAAEQAP